MREYAPDVKAPVTPTQYPTPRIHEKPQAVSCSQVNQPVRELGSSVKEKSAAKAVAGILVITTAALKTTGATFFINL